MDCSSSSHSLVGTALTDKLKAQELVGLQTVRTDKRKEESGMRVLWTNHSPCSV